MTRADKQKKVWVLYWETGADLLVRARQPDWDVTDPNDVAFAIDTIGANVPAEGWKDLAADFIQRFEQ
ncbi:hypothetical protein ACFYT3_20190 [Nocardia amikacinitolerans]|uniref:hypothetical protein n=1 Tax=Nocardia amikacinitolerans TaxID=756689 RepID=UPI0020A5D7E6|nr:hypothetical protein [Nocardia amikacinitolerans]